MLNNCTCSVDLNCLSLDKIPMSCPLVWDLLAKGQTVGIFQLESALGKHWCKTLKPTCLEHLSALGAILRPGTLESLLDDGLSITEHYCKRKNLLEPIEYLDDSLEEILKDSYGLMIYQEHAILASQKVAGFTLEEADSLRKAIGKKLPEEMAKIKFKFLEGVKKTNIISEEKANKIFDIIEKSQRYSFNHSHAIGYAYLAYYTAYLKSHITEKFFKSYCKYANEKQKPQEEIRNLYGESQLFGLKFVIPDLRDLQETFYLKDHNICFGLVNIKGIGQAAFKKIDEVIKSAPLVKGWYDTLITVLSQLTTKQVENLISSGALDYLEKSRKEKLAEFKVLNEINEKERAWYFPNKDKATSLLELLKLGCEVKKNGGAASTVRRKAVLEDLVKMLENPASSLEDSPFWTASQEEELLGVSITCSKIDGCNVDDANCDCKQYLLGKKQSSFVIAAEITQLRENKIKRGNNAGATMAYCRLVDSTGNVSAIIFPDAYKEFKNLLIDKNTVLVQGVRSKKDADSFVVQKVFQI